MAAMTLRSHASEAFLRSSLLRWMACVLIAPVGLGCAGGQRVIKLRMGGAPERIYLSATPAKAVKISDGEFRRSLASLTQDVIARREPLEAARRMFDVPARSGTYLYEPWAGRLVPAARLASTPKAQWRMRERPIAGFMRPVAR